MQVERVQVFEVGEPVAPGVAGVLRVGREGEGTGRGGGGQVESRGEPICAYGEAADGRGGGVPSGGLLDEQSRVRGEERERDNAEPSRERENGP